MLRWKGTILVLVTNVPIVHNSELIYNKMFLNITWIN
jgi:hypothetical protein